jgi:hypothetical protein
MELVDLPLSKLTHTQKLKLMEDLWDALTSEEQILDSPMWHKDILQEREKALETGQACISDWNEAKDRIKRNMACK